VHVGVCLVRQHPYRSLFLQDDSEMVAILEQKWRKNAIALYAFRCEVYLRRDLFVEVPFDCVDGHGYTSPKRLA